MTTHIREEIIDVTAAADLSAQASRFKVVTFAGTIALAADKAAFAGILKFGAQSGFIGGAVQEGVTKALVGAAVSTPGWPLKVANSGFLVAAASGDISSVVGRFLKSTVGLTTAASGDLAMVSVDFMRCPGYWGG